MTAKLKRRLKTRNRDIGFFKHLVRRAFFISIVKRTHKVLQSLLRSTSSEASNERSLYSFSNVNRQRGTNNCHAKDPITLSFVLVMSFAVALK